MSFTISTMRVMNMAAFSQKTISREHGDRMFWLGRYTERVFSGLKALGRVYDKVLDEPDRYNEYLAAFGLNDIYGGYKAFFRSFIFDINNESSVRSSLVRAYDNGIVLREEISTEALSFLQMALDKLDEAEEHHEQSLRLRLIPLEDIIYSFWGCTDDHVYDNESRYVIHCGKIIERLDFYFRLKYPFEQVNAEFERLCNCLRGLPKDTPYRYNTEQLSKLVEITGLGEDYEKHTSAALKALGKLFERSSGMSQTMN